MEPQPISAAEVIRNKLAEPRFIDCSSSLVLKAHQECNELLESGFCSWVEECWPPVLHASTNHEWLENKGYCGQCGMWRSAFDLITRTNTEGRP